MSNLDDDIIAAARAGFQDEAQDMLRQFEQALLAMEADPADREATNTAFRAAHTIKGSAGLFGYDAVVHFTHELESLLDDLRDGRLTLDDAAVALLLRGRDQLEQLLNEVGGQADPVVAAHSEALAAELRTCRAAAARAPAAAPVTEAVADPTPPALQSWRISLRMGADALRNGLDPLPFIRYLDTVGSVRAVHTLHEAVPALETLDPEGCCLAFEIALDSAAPREDIAAVFDFCIDDCTLQLDRLAPAEAAPAATTPPPAAGLLAEVLAAEVSAAPPVDRRAAQGDRRQQTGDRREGPRERRGGDDTRFIRVRADKLDKLIDLIGELVIASSGAQLVAEASGLPGFTECTLRIHDLVQEARDGALGLRMVPVGETFQRFQRVVRDVCKQLGKDVELQISGGDTELDKSMVDTVADPLMHLVRNALDHGIETAEQRTAAGKPAQGRLALHAYHESGAIVIEVSDDGRGLDRERILAKAIERGLVGPDDELDDDQVNQLIFAPGFSTAEAVTNLSGRGVGMDVVKRNIESLRGQIHIATQPGRGTTMQIRLPLTLAIIDGFLTSVGGVSYVLPLELVAECLALPPECHADPDRVTGHFDLRGEVVPYLDLGRFYGHAPQPGSRRSLVLVRDGGSRIGLLVDRLLGEHQTVIKPLGQVFQQIRGLAGSTILGSGEVALILDVAVLLSLVGDRLQHARRRPAIPAPR